MAKTFVHHLNILLVDDDADDHEFFLHAIAKAKVPVSLKIKTVKNGNEITHELMNGYGRLPDIIFLDINMPNKNGHQILEEIRQQKKLNDVAIAIFSGCATEYDICKAFQNGANLYIKKPDNLAQLIEMIEKVIALDWKEYRPFSNIENFVWTKQSLTRNPGAALTVKQPPTFPSTHRH
jgi:CheY-like chemotaxis protein